MFLIFLCYVAYLQGLTHEEVTTPAFGNDQSQKLPSGLSVTESLRNFSFLSLSPDCAVVAYDMLEATMNLQIIYNASLSFFWWQHATGHGDRQMGLIDRCNKYHGEYCTLQRDIDILLEYSEDLLNAFDNSGCCVPPQCAFDDRDIKFRVLLCSIKLFSALEIAELFNVGISFKNVTMSCGSGKIGSSSGTLCMYGLICLLACLVLCASVEVYYYSIYHEDRGEDETEAKLFWFISAFSFKKNWEALIERPERSTNFLDGVRAMSFMWVVLGHCYWTELQSFVLDNMSSVANDVGAKLWFVNFILSGLYSVDSFFWLSGFLFAYIFSKKLYKIRNPIWNSYIWWPLIYFRRWLRLIPALIFVRLLEWLVIPS
jgi:hypothetical protein